MEIPNNLLTFRLEWSYNSERAFVRAYNEADECIYKSIADGIPSSSYQGNNEPGANHLAKLIGRELPPGEMFVIISDHFSLGGRYFYIAEDTSPVVYFDRDKIPTTQYEGRINIGT